MKGFLIVIKTINVKQFELKNGIESSKCFFKGSIIDVRNEMPLQIVKLISESCIHTCGFRTAISKTLELDLVFKSF